MTRTEKELFSASTILIDKECRLIYETAVHSLTKCNIERQEANIIELIETHNLLVTLMRQLKTKSKTYNSGSTIIVKNPI